MSASNLTTHPPKRAIQVYSEYQYTQMRDVIVPLMLACPARISPYINHDIRQLFCDAGGPLFGDKRLGWLLEDCAEFITQIKRGAYTPDNDLFLDMPHMALMWRGATKPEGELISLAEIAHELLNGQTPGQIARRVFDEEFRRWLALEDRANDYDGPVLP